MIGRAVCPNCGKYRLRVWERMTLNYWVPTRCRKCRKLFVNHVGAEVAPVLPFIAAAVYLGMVGVEKEWVFVLAVLIFPLRAMLVSPIRYADFKPYGDRPWWQNVTIFVAIPVALTLVVLAMLSVFGVGKP
jgi:hypothetical protein